MERIHVKNISFLNAAHLGLRDEIKAASVCMVGAQRTQLSLWGCEHASCFQCCLGALLPAATFVKSIHWKRQALWASFPVRPGEENDLQSKYHSAQ